MLKLMLKLMLVLMLMLKLRPKLMLMHGFWILEAGFWGRRHTGAHGGTPEPGVGAAIARL